MNRKTVFANGEIYHVYNRGVDKRIIFSDRIDSDRFLRSMRAFNVKDPVRSLQLAESVAQPLNAEGAGDTEKLVEIIAYCLNPNHFHLILRQISDGGISEFMKRLSGGYTWYFNNKYERSGSLFQGKFKAIHVETNEYLLHVSAYVNLNFRVHSYSGKAADFVRSSWDEYMDESVKPLCMKDTILGQFGLREEYRVFAEQSLKGTLERRLINRELLLE